MTDFYPSPFWIFRPIGVDSTNSLIEWTEDPGGASEKNLAVSITETSSLTSGSQYFLSGIRSDPVQSRLKRTILNATDNSLFANSLLGEIASKMSAESSSSGNSWTYEFTAITPLFSSQKNSGVRLRTQQDGNVFEMDFINSDVSKRWFGFGDDTSGPQAERSDSSGALDGPYHRWAGWRSPEGKIHSLRKQKSRTFFSSDGPPSYGRSFAYDKLDRTRVLELTAVAGVHTFRYDRASRSEEANRGGVPVGDVNNSLEELWDEAFGSDAKIIVSFEEADGGLDDFRAVSPGAKLNTARLATDDFAEMYAPHREQDNQYAGERYDLRIPLAIDDPEDYEGTVKVYRH